MNETPHSLDLSIVIPVGPGDDAWRELMLLLTGLPSQSEIIISGCAEAPTDWPEFRPGVAIEQLQWLVSEPGRAQQLNHGIEHSHGRMLWLLHADSRPTPDNIVDVARCLDQHEACHDNRDNSINNRWWHFDLAFEKNQQWPVLLNAFGANLRSRLFKLPFGDQGWLMARALFERVGVFDSSWHRGEDLEWAMRAKQHGIEPLSIGKKLATSSRRYYQHGWLRTTLDHQLQMWRMIHAARRQHRELQ